PQRDMPGKVGCLFSHDGFPASEIADHERHQQENWQKDQQFYQTDLNKLENRLQRNRHSWNRYLWERSNTQSVALIADGPEKSRTRCMRSLGGRPIKHTVRPNQCRIQKTASPVESPEFDYSQQHPNDHCSD